MALEVLYAFRIKKTGDSCVVAPSVLLQKSEYQLLGHGVSVLALSRSARKYFFPCFSQMLSIV